MRSQNSASGRRPCTQRLTVDVLTFSTLANSVWFIRANRSCRSNQAPNAGVARLDDSLPMSASLLDRIPGRVYSAPMIERTPRYHGQKIAPLLAAQGRRKDWLAERAGISPAQLSRLIGGTRTVDERTAQRIAEALQVPLFLAFDLPIGSDDVPMGTRGAA